MALDAMYVTTGGWSASRRRDPLKPGHLTSGPPGDVRSALPTLRDQRRALGVEIVREQARTIGAVRRESFTAPSSGMMWRLRCSR